MQVFILILIAFGSLAFIGIGVYTIVGAWYLFDAADFASPRKPTRRELFARIPRAIRNLGIVSVSVFLACLAIGAAVSLLAFAIRD